MQTGKSQIIDMPANYEKTVVVIRSVRPQYSPWIIIVLSRP